MSDFTYKTRIADAILQKKLKSSGAVLVEGPKWVERPLPQSNRQKA